MKDLLQKEGMKVLGDRGYDQTDVTVVPDENVEESENDEENDQQNSLLYHYRVVESVFGKVKEFESASATFKQFVTIQKYVLIIAFQIVAAQIKENPLRQPNFFR